MCSGEYELQFARVMTHRPCSRTWLDLVVALLAAHQSGLNAVSIRMCHVAIHPIYSLLHALIASHSAETILVRAQSTHAAAVVSRRLQPETR